MVRFLCIGDLHFTPRLTSKIDLFCTNIVKVLDRLKIKKRLPDAIVIMGDTLDSFDKIHMQMLYRAINLFNTLATYCKVYVLIGNHDRINPTDYMSDIHPFVGYQNPNVVIVSSPKKLLADDMLFMFVPYVENGRFIEAISTIDTKGITPRIIFCHQEFKGANFGSMSSDHGDEIPIVDYTPMEFNSGLEKYKDDLKGVLNEDGTQNIYNTLIVSGHIHKWQVLQNVIYVGTPYQTSSNEDISKALLEITIDKEKYSIERFSAGIPMKTTIKLTVDQYMDMGCPEDNDKTRYIVSGSDVELQSLDSKVTKKVIYTPIDNTLASLSSFDDILKSLIPDDKHDILRSILSTTA